MEITKHIRGVMRRLDTRRAKAVLMTAVLALSTVLNAVSPMAAYAAETTAAPDTITVTGYSAFSNSSGMWNSSVQAHYATDENGNASTAATSTCTTRARARSSAGATPAG